MSPAGRTAGSQGNRGQQARCCSRNLRRGAAGSVQDKTFNRDRTFFLFPKKISNFEAESGAITNAKEVEGSLGRPVNRRPFKTLIRGYGFWNGEHNSGGGVRGTSRRTCAGADGRVSEISYNR